MGGSENGWSDAQRYLGVILATMALLGIITGAVWAWADVRYPLDDACRRVDRLEERQEAAAADSRRIERKVDRLLVEQGINPDDIR